MIFNDTNKR